MLQDYSLIKRTLLLYQYGKDINSEKSPKSVENFLFGFINRSMSLREHLNGNDLKVKSTIGRGCT